MGSLLRDFVEIVGVADPTTFPTAPTMFTQIALMETFTIPEPKPDIEQLVTVFIEVTIGSTRVIQTPIGTSLGGQILTGFKLAVEGTVRQKMFYVAKAPEQPVHAAEVEVPFSTLIVLPPLIGTIPILDLAAALKVTPFVEDVFVKVTSPRTIFKNVGLFLNVTVATPLLSSSSS